MGEIDTLSLERVAAPWACQHEDRELRHRRVNGGGVQYRYQCLECGHSVGPAIKRSAVDEEVNEWDYELKDQWEAKQRQATQEKFKSVAQARRQEYEAYLKSFDWKLKARMVLDREGHICQGCRSAKATEVHHTTYSHIFNELLFQLVALCRDCHDKAHTL
jgi:hypothetical protein